MLTLFHAPQSRSTSIIALIHEMGIEDEIDIREVDIRRGDGKGAPDPANPHPFRKVPCLQDGHELVWERSAVMLYLTDRFPGSGLGRPVGDPQRGRYVSWLAHYQGVIEPAMLLDWTKVQNDDLAYHIRTIDDVMAELDLALDHGPWLLGDRFSAADLLIAGLFSFARKVPPQPRVADWVVRVDDRPAIKRAFAEDAARAETQQA